MSHSRFRRTSGLYFIIFETSICYWQDQPGSVCVCFHTRPPLRAERGHLHVHNSPTLVRPSRCVLTRAPALPRKSERWYTINPLMTKAHTLRVCAPLHSGVRFPLGASTRESRDVAPVANASASRPPPPCDPCVVPSRALVCVAPHTKEHFPLDYEVRFPPRGARKQGRDRKRSGPTHYSPHPDHRRLASL